jgi:hypothetical protein
MSALPGVAKPASRRSAAWTARRRRVVPRPPPVRESQSAWRAKSLIRCGVPRQTPARSSKTATYSALARDFGAALPYMSGASPKSECPTVEGTWNPTLADVTAGTKACAAHTCVSQTIRGPTHCEDLSLSGGASIRS